MERYSKRPTESNPKERVAVMRSAHGRADGLTFETQAAFIIGADGAQLVAGRHITREAFGALVRNAEAHAEQTAPPAPLPFRPRATQNARADRRAA